MRSPSIALTVRAGLAAALLAAAALPARADGGDFSVTSAPFAGVKVNGGTVTWSLIAGTPQLSLSADFVVPDTPAPHWQVVDSGGRTFLLQRLVVKGDRLNRTIVLPPYVTDVARVQIWCAFAETLLGETAFAEPMSVAKVPVRTVARTGEFAGAKADAGFVTAGRRGEQLFLTLSETFRVPDTPAPHWQVVDSEGRTYLLQRLVVKGDRLNRTIAVPPQVRDVAKVQIWCAFAETLLGEASFESPLMD